MARPGRDRTERRRPRSCRPRARRSFRPACRARADPPCLRSRVRSPQSRTILSERLLLPARAPCALRVHAENALVKDSATANVTVASIEDTDTSSCSSLEVLPAKLVTLRAEDAREWHVVLDIPELPTSLIQLNDTLTFSLTTREDITLYRTLDQDIVFERDSELLLAASHRERFGAVAPPDLSDYGLELADAGGSCQGSAQLTCVVTGHTLQAAAGSDEALIGPRGSAAVGPFIVGLDAWQESSGGMCDLKSSLDLCAIREP